MADINTPETTDVDVETLMGLIRRRVYGLPDARYIMGEIERVRLKADAIVTGRIGEAGPQADAVVNTRPKRLGWKVGVKGRVATLIVRAVRMNFRFQEVFNNSVVGVLQLMAEDLYAYERRLDAAGRAGETERASAGAFDRAAYEEAYLDPKPFARRSLSLFQELLGQDDVALELFCGRGELLAAFAANGIEAVGVEPDAALVSLCRGRGLQALHADIFEHLRDSPDASYGGIFAGRVVERLTNEQTAELLGLAKRKLRRGGLFVASATNIDHLPALRKFYLDPSLVRPVPAKLLGFMLERSGLSIHQFRFSNADGEELSEPALAREVYPYDEYTVVAVND
ncbi:MAG: class I SAM-dependent methyltransferase [Acidobacteria bacterium]|nr:class I SAM-dependent methyltransferase [Acidobacteriota bacterium]